MCCHHCSCIGRSVCRRATPKWPEAPEAVRKVAEAKDPEAALESISGGAEWLPCDREALVTEREIRPRRLVAGRDVYDQDVEDLSEPEIREDRL